MAGKYKTPLDDRYAHRAERAQIVLLTGWTFEQIDALGFQDRADLLQVKEAQNKLEADAVKAARRKPRK